MSQDAGRGPLGMSGRLASHMAGSSVRWPCAVLPDGTRSKYTRNVLREFDRTVTSGKPSVSYRRTKKGKGV